MFPLYDTIRTRHFPWMNWMLILTNAGIFFYELALAPLSRQRFIQTWGLVPAHFLLQPQSLWPTIFTSMFIHGSWLHAITNLWILAIFGDNVEDSLGSARYFLFYLMSGLAAALLQIYLLPDSAQPMIGASGAIAGVLGAYLIFFPQARVVSFVPILFIFTVIEIPAFFYLFVWFLSQIFSGLFALEGTGTSEIAWWAHIGGFLFGIFAAPLLAWRRIHTHV